MPSHTYTSVNTTPVEILKTLAVRILQHPWVKVPRITLPDGRPVPINKVRLNTGGIEVQNQQGITLSLSPYSFVDAVNPKLTVTSGNATYVPTPQTTGRGSRADFHANNYDIIKFHVLATLSLFRFELPSVPLEGIPSTEGLTLQVNPLEQVLMNYAVMLKAIITDHLRGLRSLDNSRDLVQSLTVQWVDFPTSDWTKGANAVNHVAHLLIEAMYVEHTAIVAEPMFISSASGPAGSVPDPDDPAKMIPVGYDWINNFYYRMDTRPYLPLTAAQITDPTTGGLYSTINTSAVTLAVTNGTEIHQEVVTMGPTSEP